MPNSLVIVFLDNLAGLRPELERVAARLRLQPEHLSLRAFLEQDEDMLPGRVHTAVLSAFFGGLGDVFLAVHKLKTVPVPHIVVHPLTAWYGSVVLDLQDMGALVLPPAPTVDQIVQVLDTANAAEERFRRRGITILLSGSSDPWVISPQGGEQEYKLGAGRQRDLFFRLTASAGNVVLTNDLAIDAECPPHMVKVYIQRLRDRYELVQKKLGLKTSASAFIEEFGGGYRLNARIRRPI